MSEKYAYITQGEGVKTYSLKKDGNKIFYYQKPFNFTVKEFACHDGSDTIKIDSDLVIALQEIREHFKVPVIINSAYRTPAYNKAVGGATRSQHIYGKAADINVSGVAPLTVAQYVENNCSTIHGIGLYTWGCHIDTRKSKYYWDYRSGKEVPVDTFQASDIPLVAVPVLRCGSKGLQVYNLQKDLIYCGYDIAADGVFGSKTEQTLKDFQTASNIPADGIYGNQTRAKMQERLML